MGESERPKESDLRPNKTDALDIANQILWTLAHNGGWHSHNGLRRIMGIHNAAGEMMFCKALSFLKAFDFIEHDEARGRCRIHRDFRFPTPREAS